MKETRRGRARAIRLQKIEKTRWKRIDQPSRKGQGEKGGELEERRRDVIRTVFRYWPFRRCSFRILWCCVKDFILLPHVLVEF
jgi:hypothetical protein